MKHTLTALVFGVTLLLASGGVGYAQDFQKGVKAYDKGDIATALREWRPLAEQGDAEAQYNLGQMYRKGKGVLQDYKEAVKWYRKSAEHGLERAQNILGFMYANGKGVTQDYKEAVKWYRKSAEQGNAWAQSSLSAMYGLGKGVLQDKVYTHMWANIAASNGDANGGKLRDLVAEKMSASDISEAQKLARECVRKKYKGC